uniref:15-cis-phytoene synthase n=1 Tax=Steinernema glaseri TaxID=37863 RepID=A0A1I8AD08_9BILA
MDSFKLCIDLVKKHDFSNYAAALLMPREVQPHVFALLAFNVELALVRDHIERNAGTAGIFRLQFWRDAISAIYGRTNDPVPRQPVAIALRLFGSEFDVDHLYGLVEARQQTLGDRPFKSVGALESYAEKTNGAMNLMIMNAISRHSNEILTLEMKKAALAMGKSLGIINHLRSTVPLLKRGVVILPMDLMTIHGLSADNVYSNKSPDGIRDLARDLASTSSKWLMESRKLAPFVSRNMSLALMANGTTIDYLLATMSKNKYNLFDARLQRGHPLQAWKLLWKKMRGTY